MSSVAGIQGVPYIANCSATKPYVLSLGEAVHRELSARGVHMTVLVPGATATAMTARFGADKTAMGRLMMSADACAAEGLTALAANRALFAMSALTGFKDSDLWIKELRDSRFGMRG